MIKWLAVGLSLVACDSGVRYGAKVGDHCPNRPPCESLAHGFCAAREGICTRLCGPQMEGNDPLGGVLDTSCPPGTACSRESPRMVCLPTCTYDHTCPENFRCDQGVCRFAVPCARYSDGGCVAWLPYSEI